MMKTWTKLMHVLEDLKNKLDAVNEEIINLMLQDKTDDEIVTEPEKEYEYEEVFALIKLKTQNSNIRVGELRPEINNDVSNPNILPLCQHSTRLKLPKIDLVKFGGDTRDWLHFWSLFRQLSCSDN
jgi:anion-transporting  ArsA/GET3 family ATPase